MRRQLALELVKPADPTFENFVPGRNREIVDRLQALAAGRSDERSIYLWGIPGSGRTHLMRAAYGAMREAGLACEYVACSRDTGAMPATERLACLFVDDVERLPDAGQIALFNACNALRERAGALVAAGDAPPVQLPLRPDVVTRLGWGLVYQVQALTDDEKTRALADYAGRLGFSLDEGIAGYLLQHLARDMGTLLAMVRALDRHSLETKRPVTLPLVRELVRKTRGL